MRGLAVVLAVAAGCGGGGGHVPATELLSCDGPDNDGQTCQPADPPLSQDCQWELSCGAYALCACDDDVYSCEVSTIHTGDACTAENANCSSGCDDPASAQACTCVDGAWQCHDDCSAGCPLTFPSGACNLDPSIGCTYKFDQASCSCQDGSWSCAD